MRLAFWRSSKDKAQVPQDVEKPAPASPKPVSYTHLTLPTIYSV